eukprot:115799_1
MSLAFHCLWNYLLIYVCYGQSVSVPIEINGIFPGLSATAASAPKRSECGIGALIPWADRLYMISYLSVHNAGTGTGLYEIHPNMTMRQIAKHNCTYANRLLHPATNQIVIGPYLIDANRNLRVITDLLSVRIGATAQHIQDSDTMVYMLSMDGPLYEVDITPGSSLKAIKLFDLPQILHIPSGEQPHFKAAHTMNDTLFVCSNTFSQQDMLGTVSGGRFAQWHGSMNSTNNYGWEIIENTAFVEVTGRHNFGRVVYAVGWDNASAILMQKDFGDKEAPSTRTTWRKYRLPKASHAFDHFWQTEWPRIREIETERYLADIHGQFYELSPLGWAGSTWGLRPVSQHLRVIPDYTSFRGMLVLGGNEVSPIMDNNWVTGQAQSGLYFGKTDDLWSFGGKPQGWGGPWRKHFVTAGKPSDSFLMTGFDKKVLHITAESSTPMIINFDIQIDFEGIAEGIAGDDYVVYETVSVNVTSSGTGYIYHVFPNGFSAHWVRIVPSHDCIATAIFHYT